MDGLPIQFYMPAELSFIQPEDPGFVADAEDGSPYLGLVTGEVPIKELFLVGPTLASFWISH
jgi:hypothetical protein